MLRLLIALAVGFCIGAVSYRTATKVIPQRTTTATAAPANPYYETRRSIFAQVGGHFPIVFVGDSITEQGPWHELLQCHAIANRGIGGSTSEAVKARLDQVIALRPTAIFLMIGAVDAAQDIPAAVTAQNVQQILARVRAAGIKAILQMPLPARKSGRDGVTNANLTKLDTELAKLGEKSIDLDPLFKTSDGFLREDLSYNVLHLSPAGYQAWRDAIAPLVKTLCN